MHNAIYGEIKTSRVVTNERCKYIVFYKLNLIKMYSSIC